MAAILLTGESAMALYLKMFVRSFSKWLPFCLRDESAMALYLKMFVRSYSIIVPNFKFVSQRARFGQNFTPTTPLKHCLVIKE